MVIISLVVSRREYNFRTSRAVREEGSGIKKNSQLELWATWRCIGLVHDVLGLGGIWNHAPSGKASAGESTWHGHCCHKLDGRPCLDYTKKKVKNSPTEIVWSASSFLSYWTGLQKTDDRAPLEAGAEVLKTAALFFHRGESPNIAGVGLLQWRKRSQPIHALLYQLLAWIFPFQLLLAFACGVC